VRLADSRNSFLTASALRAAAAALFSLVLCIQSSAEPRQREWVLDDSVSWALADQFFGSERYSVDSLILSTGSEDYDLVDTAILIWRDSADHPLLSSPEVIRLGRPHQGCDFDSVCLYVYTIANRYEIEDWWFAAAALFQCGKEMFAIIWRENTQSTHGPYHLGGQGIDIVDSVVWLPRDGHAGTPLLIAVSTNGMLWTSDFAAIWRVTADSVWYLGALKTTSYGSGTFSSENELSFVNDSAPIIHYRRNLECGGPWHSVCQDPAIISLLLSDNSIIATSLVFENGLRMPIRTQVPFLVFDEWMEKIPHHGADRSSDTPQSTNATVRSRMQGIPLKSDSLWGLSEYETNNQVIECRQLPAQGTVAYAITDDSLEVHVGIIKRAMQNSTTEADRSLPLAAAVWIDTELQSDIDDPALSNDDILILLRKHPDDSVAHAEWYQPSICGERSITCQLTQSVPCKYASSYYGYSYTFRVPRKEIGFFDNDSLPAHCGFAVEILEYTDSPEIELGATVAQSIPSFRRNDPTTWGMLLKGIRENRPPKNRN